MAYIDETGLAEVTTKLKTYIDNKASGGGDPANEFDLLLSGNYGYMTESVCNEIIQGTYIYNGGIN